MARNKKPTPLDLEIRRLEKNARNKISRMRVKGVSDEDLSAIDPRQAQLKGQMNGSQKAAYARRLARFNERGSYVVGQDAAGNVGVVRGAVIRAYKAAEKAANDLKNKVIKAAERMYGNRPFARETAPNGMSREQYNFAAGPGAGDAAAEKYRRGFLGPVRRQYGFSSEAQAKRAIEAQKGAMERVRDVDRQLGNYRTSIVNRMREEGAPEEVWKAVRSLTNQQLQYLYYNTDFAELTGRFNYKTFYQRHTRVDDSYREGAYQPVIEMVQLAKREFPRGRFHGVTR